MARYNPDKSLKTHEGDCAAAWWFTWETNSSRTWYRVDTLQKKPIHSLYLPSCNLNMLHQQKSMIGDGLIALISWILVKSLTYCPKSQKIGGLGANFIFLMESYFKFEITDAWIIPWLCLYFELFLKMMKFQENHCHVYMIYCSETKSGTRTF